MLHTALVVAALSFGCAAHGHQTVHPRPAAQVTVSFHWAWADAHWSHGHWNRGKWVKKPGPHPRAHHADWRWSDGHHAGHGPNRRWVPGHWSHR
jgi:hypothetical protein